MVDIGEVMAYADGFGSAVRRDDKQLVSHYVNHGDKTTVDQVLELLPRPIDSAEVLRVELGESSEWITLMRFSGSRDEVRLRTVWLESGDSIHIRSARICGRKTRQLAS